MVHAVLDAVFRHAWQACATLALAATGAAAQATPPAGQSPGLKQVFEAAWNRQPEARSLQTRRDAASARREAADSWTAEPPSLELSGRSDRLNRNQGTREYDLGVALPLWLPGERSGMAALADAEQQAVASRALGAQLRIAAEVRAAWWNWQRAHIDRELAAGRLAGARQLAADVARRVAAGDLARADQHQADGAASSAESALAEASGALAAAVQQLAALSGMPAAFKQATTAMPDAEPLPSVPATFSDADTRHPAIRELLDRAEVARRAAELARVQKRANPELTLGTTREREAFGDSYQQALTLGIRFPFGSDARSRHRAAAAQAEAIEAGSQLELERHRLLAGLEAARLRIASARAQVEADSRRAKLADEAREFFDKSFRLGESDLPTRLRIELEAVEAGRQAARARIELAAAISALRQTLGLLPE